MVKSFRMVAAAALALLLAACHSPPPRPWLRYELDGTTDWGQLGNGRFGGSLLGAEVTIELYDQTTRVLAVVENRGEQSFSVAIGPDAGAPEGVVGEVLMRQIDGPPAGGPGMVPYVAMKPVTVDGGWRATFYLDRPLGREIKLGQYFVLATEVTAADGSRKRALLPIVGKMGGVQRGKPR
ncbi:MAG: hypothetical protein KAI24_12785 [Planctomycetes bacterium]|nr:hypothetical protein [Planctomycetota bacterium]